MNDEISHIAQWIELITRAQNFGYSVTFTSEHLALWDGSNGRSLIGSYTSLADLRAAISDHVAARRASGERI